MTDSSAESQPAQLLLVDCPDRRGLVHAITGLLLARGANILTNDEFVDRETDRFFMRTEFIGAPADDLVADVRAALPQPSSVRLGRAGLCRIVVLATREPHCLGELLLRHASGDLGARVEAVISNHEWLEPLSARFDVPFHCVPHGDLDRAAHEDAILRAIEPYRPDYLVLAKYMRVLTSAFVARFRERIINIHHSFLPAFIGANPYKQAFDRGVKIIGATAHFVTDDLDEGPIIAQDTVHVDHSHRPDEMARAGRDVEKIVLAKALKLVFEDRVFLSGKRTVVFE